jgi:hypothetical protein
VLSSLLVLVSCAPRAREGEMTIMLPDSTTVPGHYRFRWGHFVTGRGLAEPGWQRRLSTLTFAGSIEILGRDTLVCDFAVDGQRFGARTGDMHSDRSRSLSFETTCRDHPAYRVVMEVAETQKRISVSTGATSRGARPTYRQSYSSPKREYWIGLEGLRQDTGWVLLGSDIGKL